MTWDSNNCQQAELSVDGVRALTGILYVYAYDNGSMAITPNNAAGDTQIVVTDCGGNDIGVEIDGGIVGFGNQPGFNPCLTSVPLQESSWGRLKQEFGGSNK